MWVKRRISTSQKERMALAEKTEMQKKLSGNHPRDERAISEQGCAFGQVQNQRFEHEFHNDVEKPKLRIYLK